MARGAPAPLTAEEQNKINQAIAQGMFYLSNTQDPSGTWAPHDGTHPTGWAALPGLTLLQCGVPADNLVIQRTARYVRDSYLKVENTYEVALALLFLDQYDEANLHVGGSLAEARLDARVIEVLAVRLMAAQSITGGWGYTSKPLSNQYHRWMLHALKQRPLTRASLPPSLRALPVFRDPARLMVTDEDTADPKQEPGAKEPTKKKSRRRMQPATPVADATSDNSVTHFALLALWTAKHRGVPVDRSLRLLTKRFRTSQSADGSWNYKYQKGGGLPESPPMICAGLLGLALQFGLSDAAQSKYTLPGPAGAAHLAFAMMGSPSPASFAAAAYTTGQSLAADRAATRRANDRTIVRGFEALTRHVGLPTGRFQNVPQGNLYFLWALERVAVLYDLKAVGGKDWYRWGAEQLVANQKQNGNWDGAYPGVIDTCFALLFLKQANLTSDLTTKLKEPNALTKLVKASPPPPPAKPVSPPSKLVTAPAKPVAPPPVQTSPPPATEPSSVSKTASTSPPATAAKEEEPKKGKTWLVAAVGGLALVLLACSAVLLLMSRRKDNAGEMRRGKRAPAGRQGNGRATDRGKASAKKKTESPRSASAKDPENAEVVARKKARRASPD